MRRREFVLGSAALAAAPLSRAQKPARVPVVGALYPNPSKGPGFGPFGSFANWAKVRLGELGWKLGSDVLLEDASAEGDNDRLPALAAALVAKQVDVIWVAGPEAATAAALATREIPIVLYGVRLPVEQGFVDSLARPGRNVTGLAGYAGHEDIKRLELLRELVPQAARLAYLRTATAMKNLAGQLVQPVYDTLEAAARRLRFDMPWYDVAQREDYDAAFEAILADRPEALAVQFTALTFRERAGIVGFARRHRLPDVHGAEPLVVAGGLAYYGPSRVWMVRHSWTWVDRILRGAKAAELPVELPSQFDLIVNLKTAAGLGLTVPQSVLVRATRVIE